jgi:hypothetical protein
MRNREAERCPTSLALEMKSSLKKPADHRTPAVSSLDKNTSLYWWAHQDLNLEPTDYESAALTN